MLLLLLEFLHLGFQVVHVDLHFVLKSDVPSDIGFQFLDDLFVFFWWLSFCCHFRSLGCLDHMK